MKRHLRSFKYCVGVVEKKWHNIALALPAGMTAKGMSFVLVGKAQS